MLTITLTDLTGLTTLTGPLNITYFIITSPLIIIIIITLFSLKTRFPELFHQTNIDQCRGKRAVKMQVLVMSMSMMRTGTMCELICYIILYFDLILI